MKNVKVIIENGEVQVVGINKDGSVSKVAYNVVEVVGLKEYGVAAMKAGAAKQYEQLKAVAGNAPTQPVPQPAQPKPQARVKEVVYTKGQVFTDIKAYGTRAVKFNIANKGECVIGFAKDRNAFLEAYNGVTKEVTKSEVLRRLNNYKGEDATTVVSIIQGLKPVSLVADHCQACGCQVTHRVKDFSLRHFGHVLCRPCQTNGNRPQPKPQPAPQTQPAPKAPERSEGATAPTPPAKQKPKSKLDKEIDAYLDAVKTCTVCGDKGDGPICGSCLEAEYLAYWNETCKCGAAKENAYETCEDCRENTWNTTDADQLNLFAGDNTDIVKLNFKRELEPGEVEIELIEGITVVANDGGTILDDPSIEVLDMDDEPVESPCGCGAVKTPGMHMCEDCTNDAELRHNEKDFGGGTSGASEASTPETETEVDGDGIAALDSDTLGALGLNV